MVTRKGGVVASPLAPPGPKTQLQAHNPNGTGRTTHKAPSDVVHLSEIPSSATVWKECR